ncbi:MAG TPA: type II toxin-antitoxin system prevent-host-death family antitoxin [Candidatus Baltobacteraceae bacterium]
MKTIGAYEAKTHLPRLLDEVAAGESITITKRGIPVAVLSPASVKPNREEQVRLFREWRDAHGPRLNMTSQEIKDLVTRGRRH